MNKLESRNTKSETSMKPGEDCEVETHYRFRISHFGFQASSLFRISKFGFRISQASALVLLMLALTPSRAAAHLVTTGMGPVYDGIGHLLLTPEDLVPVLAMIAVGIWGGQLGNPALWLLPVTFPMVMSMGAMLGLLGIPLPGVEIGIAVSAILLGAMVVGEVRPKLIVAALLIGFFAMFHGHAHGTELPAGQSGLLYSMGFVIATGCLHGVGIAIGLFHCWPAGRLALRGAGALISVMGMTFLWNAL